LFQQPAPRPPGPVNLPAKASRHPIRPSSGAACPPSRAHRPRGAGQTHFDTFLHGPVASRAKARVPYVSRPPASPSTAPATLASPCASIGQTTPARADPGPAPSSRHRLPRQKQNPAVPAASKNQHTVPPVDCTCAGSAPRFGAEASAGPGRKRRRPPLGRDWRPHSSRPSTSNVEAQRRTWATIVRSRFLGAQQSAAVTPSMVFARPLWLFPGQHGPPSAWVADLGFGAV